MSESLWGKLPTGENLRTPIFVLREQAEILTKATEGVLVGRVQSQQRTEVSLLHQLQIVAPALNQYVYTVLAVSHSVMVYPASVTDLGKNLTRTARDEDELKLLMKDILTLEPVRKAIAGLMAQSRDAAMRKS